MSSEGYNPDEDSSLNEEQKELVKKVLKDEKGKADVVITVEKKEESDRDKEQDKFWSEAVSDIQSEYKKLGKNFDPSSIKSAEDIKKAFEDISNLRERKETPRSGTPLTGRQLGYEEPTGDRDVQVLKESCRDIPLDLLEYNSEKEMKDLLDAIANDTNDPRQKEAEKLRMKITKSSVNRDRAIELTTSLADALHGKAKWKIKKREDDD